MINKINIDQTHQLAITNFNTGKREEAERLFREVLKTNPSHFDANHYLAIVLVNLGRLDEAVILFKKTLELKPDSDVFQNFADTLIQLKKFEEAEINYRKVLEFNPDNIDIQYNLGNTLKILNRLDEAEVVYKKTIDLKPDYFNAHHNLAITLNSLNKLDESLKYWKIAKTLKPDADFLLGTILYLKMQLNIWDELQSELQELTKKINNGEKFINPFPTLSLIDDPELHRKAAKIYLNNKTPKSNLFPKISKYHSHEKIKIGYFSTDFNNHPVGKLTAELYELHDRKKFEIHAFSFGLDKKDETNTRIRKGVDHFYDVHKISDINLVKLARSLEIDIAIDLTGYTAQNRAEIFAMKVAPIQINYLGYTSTTGADYMNYLIADKTIIPEKNKKYYSEKIVYLPNNYMVNESKVKVSEKLFIRKDVGLPAEGFVFCCFNTHFKISPITFAGWMRILKAVDGSVLWLLPKNENAVKNLKKEAKKHGIDESRLIFAPSLDLNEDHLSRQKLADLFLDTLPYNAHITASEALRMGLPVLTCMAQAFSGRVAASLLKAVNLSEMITTTQEQYERLAIELATNPEKLKIIKNKLANNLPTAPLYDTPLFTKNLEAAYQVMYEKYQNDLNLDDIEIKN
jgi:protein O-GlcNAc transferase